LRLRDIRGHCCLMHQASAANYISHSRPRKSLMNWAAAPFIAGKRMLNPHFGCCDLQQKWLLHSSTVWRRSTRHIGRMYFTSQGLEQMRGGVPGFGPAIAIAEL
jgi:hypothetical protein